MNNLVFSKLNNTLNASINFVLSFFYKRKEKVEELKKFVYKSNKRVTTISPKKFHNTFTKSRWYLTKDKYRMFLTGLYYTGYEKLSDRLKGQKQGTDQFLEFYDKLVFFIGKYYKYTQSKKLNSYDNDMQIAQVQFIKFLDNGKVCVIKNNKSYINVLNYSKPDARVITKPKNFKYAFLKCATKKHNIVSSMLLFDENEDEGHANTLIISYKTGSIWRVEPNIYYYWNPFFYDNLDKALVKYFNVDNKDINLTYKGLYPYTLKSTPDHVGLCVMISALQLYLPRNMTDFNVKYYLLKFFEWEYKKIFHETFTINNESLIDLTKFIHKKYGLNDFEINGKDYKFKGLTNDQGLTNNQGLITKIVAKRKNTKENIILEKPNPKYNIEYNQKNLPKQNVFDYIR
jgi:hypothetical protein